MTTKQPTTSEIRANIIAQLESAIGQTIPLLPKSFLYVLASVIAAVHVTLYKYASFIALQQFVQTATISDTLINGVSVSPLKQWGRLVGVGDPIRATAAEVVLELTVDTLGGTLPSGTQFARTTTGFVYLTTTLVSLDASPTFVTVRASNDQAGGGGLGVGGNLSVGDELSFVTPLPAVRKIAVVSSIVVTAADAETDDAYRARILDRFQKRPQGGALADYEQWAEEAAGVLNAYPYTGNPGIVDVYIESSTEPDGIPTQAQLDAAKVSIELDEDGLATRRPVGAFVRTLPITRTQFDVFVEGLLVDDAAQVRADIEQAATDWFLEKAPFIEGLTVPPRRDQITVAGLGGLIEDVVTAAGGVFVGVRMSVNGLNETLYSLAEGEKAKLGSIAFT